MGVQLFQVGRNQKLDRKRSRKIKYANVRGEI